MEGVSSHPSHGHLDLTGVEGDYVVRGWTRPRIAGLIGYLLITGLLVLEALLLHERPMLVWSAVLLVLALVSIWRRRGQAVTTTISQTGITIDQGGGQREKTQVAWEDASEVYVAGAWQAHSSVRTRTNREVSLPGVDRTRARKLADALRAVR